MRLSLLHNSTSGLAQPFGGPCRVEGIPSARLIRFGTFGRGVWHYVPSRPSQ